MNILSMRKLILLLLVLSIALGSCKARLFNKNPERRLEANDRKLKKDSEKSVKRSQKRTVDIQTPEVQARMKKNKKDYILRDKDKKKKVKEGTKRAAKKYN